MTALATGLPAEVPRQTRDRFRALVWCFPLVVTVLLTGLITLALAGAARDDAAIEARTGRATAQVLAVSPMRTSVQFAVPGGKVYRPDEGVAYPSGLQVGQLVRVEYDTADPAQVRVMGHSWTEGLVPAMIILAALWVLAVPLTWWLRRRRPRLGARVAVS
ncbi:MAG: DUF3592 domain-containing protein [Pseudonocardiaceae bacterium]